MTLRIVHNIAEPRPPFSWFVEDNGGESSAGPDDLIWYPSHLPYTPPVMVFGFHGCQIVPMTGGIFLRQVELLSKLIESKSGHGGTMNLMRGMPVLETVNGRQRH